MKAGILHKVFAQVDPKPIITMAGTETHAVIFAMKPAQLDLELTENGWTRSGGFWYAPKLWQNIRVVVPAKIDYSKQARGLYIIDPADERYDFLFFSRDEQKALTTMKLFGWKKTPSGYSRVLNSAPQRNKGRRDDE